MQIQSLGYQTDLALLSLGSSEVTHNGDHLLVRSPHNPTFWWGNFILLPAPPAADVVPTWLAKFAEQFPDAEHVAFGFDGVAGTVADLAGFTAAGLNVEASVVMTAQRVTPPPRPNAEAVYRTLESDDDWAQHVELRVACNDNGSDEADHRTFAQAKANTMRGLAAAGHGAWFGAFVDGQLLSSMGLFRASEGLARFQSVETHPDARRRGLAGSLVHYVSEYGFNVLAAHTLVMVADPDYSAIRVYRAVGFGDTEVQLQAERPPINRED